MQFDSNGNSTPGIHKIGYDILEEKFVADFSDSLTRKRNLDGLVSYLKSPFFYENKDIFTKIWIDGSFSTQKLNPNDIDGILFINPLVKGIEETVKIIESFYFNIKKQGSLFFADLYLCVDMDELPEPTGSDPYYNEYYGAMDYQFKYWMGQFCFDRKRQPKGILELDFEGGTFHGN